MLIYYNVRCDNFSALFSSLQCNNVSYNESSCSSRESLDDFLHILSQYSQSPETLEISLPTT